MLKLDFFILDENIHVLYEKVDIVQNNILIGSHTE